MPVPVTTAALALSAIFALMGADLGAIIVGSAGVFNQVLVTFVGGPKVAVPEEEA